MRLQVPAAPEADSRVVHLVEDRVSRCAVCEDVQSYGRPLERTDDETSPRGKRLLTLAGILDRHAPVRNLSMRVQRGQGIRTMRRSAQA